MEWKESFESVLGYHLAAVTTGSEKFSNVFRDFLAQNKLPIHVYPKKSYFRVQTCNRNICRDLYCFKDIVFLSKLGQRSGNPHSLWVGQFK